MAAPIELVNCILKIKLTSTCRLLLCLKLLNYLTAHVKDLGGFNARRSLPHDEVMTVGPFIFFDHLGPAVFASGKGVDVRPHPHINLATVTYFI